MKDAVIIVSGGLDSTTLLYDKQDDIGLALSFDYGQNHKDNELPLAAYHCQRLGIPHHIISLDFMQRLFKSSLLEGAEMIPEGDYAVENMQSTVVPFRNGIMLSIAAGIAESKGFSRLYLANHGGDHALYPDCRADFMAAMSDAISRGTYNHTKIEAAYTHITKKEIVAIGLKLGIDYAQTWSCYKGGAVHCGRCATCLERQEAFRSLGVVDPTTYLEK